VRLEGGLREAGAAAVWRPGPEPEPGVRVDDPVEG